MVLIGKASLQPPMTVGTGDYAVYYVVNTNLWNIKCVFQLRFPQRRQKYVSLSRGRGSEPYIEGEKEESESRKRKKPEGNRAKEWREGWDLELRKCDKQEKKYMEMKGPQWVGVKVGWGGDGWEEG